MERQQARQGKRNRCEGGGDWHWVRIRKDNCYKSKEIPIGRWVSRNLTWKYKADDQYESRGGEEREESRTLTQAEARSQLNAKRWMRSKSGWQREDF